VEVVRKGVIGAGVMGERHCRVCSNLPFVELVGVADLEEARGRQVAELYETMYFSDHRPLFSQVDAVTIAASKPVHYELAEECLTHRSYNSVNQLLNRPKLSKFISSALHSGHLGFGGTRQEHTYSAGGRSTVLASQNSLLEHAEYQQAP
jgi:hypothetical protein